MEEQSNEALWYVVHTYSGYENKVANDLQTMVENRRLQDLICDIKVPTEMVPEIKDGTSCATRAAAPASSAPHPSPFLSRRKRSRRWVLRRRLR